MDNITLQAPSLASLLSALEAMLEGQITDKEADDIDFSILRLEDAIEAKGKLVCVDDLDKFKDTFKVQEGYWVINGKAHYICLPR